MKNIILLVDRSGSMESILEATHEGLNGFIRNLDKDDEVTIYMFDDKFEIDCLRKPIVEIGNVVIKPRGSTALIDAMCKAIDDIGLHIAKDGCRGDVVFVTVTDGIENSSHLFTWNDAQKRVSHQEDNYNWKFVYLGANQDAIATAAKMGVSANSAMTYGTSSGAIKATFDSLTVAVDTYSRTKSLSFSPEDRKKSA